MIYRPKNKQELIEQFKVFRECHIEMLETYEFMIQHETLNIAEAEDRLEKYAQDKIEAEKRLNKIEEFLAKNTEKGAQND